MAHPMNVTGKNRPHIACLHQGIVHLSPVLSIPSSQPTGMMQEDKHMPGTRRLGQRFFEPIELFLTHALRFGTSGCFFTGLRIAFV